jgi:osmotically-inducible protein OsmY
MKPAKLLLALSPLLLTGCVAAAVGAGTEAGVSLAEERSVGRKVDDITIYTDINRLFIKEGTNELFADVTIDVRHARVLLTGNVKSDGAAQRAVELAWKARGVEEVINELVVGSNASWGDAAQDAVVKKNLEARLLVTKHVWVINYSINVVNGTTYLLGRVADQAELNRVLNVTRTTRGVKRVVNYLQIRPQNDAAVPANTGSYATPSSTGSYAAPAATDYSAPSSSPAPAASSAPVSSGGMGSDGYAAPELIQSSPLPAAQ